MSIILPLFPSPQKATPRYLDFGVTLDGGPIADGPRFGLLGNRWALDVQMLMPMEPRKKWPVGARVWLSRLREARIAGAILPWYPQRMKVGAPGAPVIAADTPANINALPIMGARPSYVFREGQFFNLVVGGRHYLHSVRAETVVAGDGTCSLPIDPLTRVASVEGDTLRMDPVIEGKVRGEEQSWDQDPAALIPVAFSVEEYGVWAEEVE